MSDEESKSSCILGDCVGDVNKLESIRKGKKNCIIVDPEGKIMAADGGTPIRELCKGLLQLAAQIEMHLSNGMALSSTTASSSLKIKGTASAAVKQESTEVINAEQEPGINAPEIIAVAQECERSKPIIIPAAQESLRIEPVIIEEQAEQVESVTYEIFNHGGSYRGNARLIDSNGYTYYISYKSAQGAHWYCTHHVSSKRMFCQAVVRQRGAVFLPGKHRHNHEPKVGKVTARRIEALVREEAYCNLLKPVSAIVNEILHAQFGSAKPPPYLVKWKLVRMAKSVRKFAIDQHHQELAFEVNDHHIPEEFLKGDILKHGKRHLIFATEEQLQLLRKAKSWYIDKMLHCCPEKFEQLFTISTFVSSEDKDAKNVPLVFVLMSSSKRKDYRKVLKKILDVLPTAPAVQKITAFYEETLWSVLHQVLSDATIKGCVYHWTQLAKKKIQELGLQTAYNSDRETNLFLRKVMALPFLPEEEIHAMFVRLWVQATTSPLQLFIEYISTSWIYNTTWPSSTWSVFCSVVRSDKDVEGWNESLKGWSFIEGRSVVEEKQLNENVLVNFLFKEARNLNGQRKALSEKKVLKRRSQNSASMQAKFCQNWEDFKTQRKSAEQLLNACADVNTSIVKFV